MRLIAAVLFLIPAWTVAQIPVAAGRTGQSSSGSCSPNIVASGNGPVTVHLIGSCNGIDPRLVRELTQNMQNFLAHFPKTIDNLNELLEKNKAELAEKVREVEDWTKKYRALSQRLQDERRDDELSKQANDALKGGHLERAEVLLKELLAKEEKQIARIAHGHFNLAELYSLRSQKLLALPEYEMAYQYQPRNFMYAQEYAELLYEQKRYQEAEPVYLAALRNAQDLREHDVSPAVATILANLGGLYFKTKRTKEAMDAYTQAVSVFQRLAKENAAAYRLGFAGAMSNLGDLYHALQRPKEAEDAYLKSLEVYLQLDPTKDAADFESAVTTMEHLGHLYRDTQRPKDAEDMYASLLKAHRGLAEANPEATYPAVAVARTLNYLGRIYVETQRPKEAEDAFTEALGIYRELTKQNPSAYSDFIVVSLLNIVRVSSQDPSRLCALVEEALKTAKSPQYKDAAVAMRRKVCATPK